MISGKKTDETQDSNRNVLSLTPRPKIDLRDAHAIRRELAALYRDARGGKVRTQDATRMAFILDLLRRAYETSVLQARIEQFEKTNQPKGVPQ